MNIYLALLLPYLSQRMLGRRCFPWRGGCFAFGLWMLCRRDHGPYGGYFAAMVILGSPPMDVLPRMMLVVSDVVLCVDNCCMDGFVFSQACSACLGSWLRLPTPALSCWPVLLLCEFSGNFWITIGSLVLKLLLLLNKIRID
jgi:hypothetical protein